MNASTFLDKQIMDLSRSKSDPNTITNNSTTTDIIDLMNPQSEEDTNDGLSSSKKKDGVLASYDFQPISRSSFANATIPTDTARARNSFDSMPNSAPFRNYSSGDPVESKKVVLDKAQKVNDSAMLSEIDRTMKKYTENLLHAIDSVSARLSQLESRTRDLEYSVDDLKVSIDNNHGSADGKMRQLENILLEVQTGMQDIKDKQEVMEGHMQLAKLQIPKVEKSSEAPNVMHVEPVQAQAASAPLQAQQSNLQQFPVSVPQPMPSLPPNALSQHNIHPPPPGTRIPRLTPSQIPQRDAYFPSSVHIPEASSQQYQIPPPSAQSSAPQPQQYPQLPHQRPSVAAAIAPLQFQPPPLGHHPEESPYMPAQTYPPSLLQPTPQPSSSPPQSHPYYGSPSPMFEPPQSIRSSSGFSVYGPPSGPSDPYPYAGPPSHHGSSASIKPQPHSQIPTARILPQAIPTAAPVSGRSSSDGSGKRAPVEDVVGKVTNMGFPREHVKATVRKLAENGQSVDLNAVLDKLMNDGDVQPNRDWFGR